MWSKYYQATLSHLLRKSILLLCSENVPFDDKLEIDGIICISTASATDGRQIVVKVHEIVENAKEKGLTTSEGTLIPGSECSNQSMDGDETFAVEGKNGGMLVSTADEYRPRVKSVDSGLQCDEVSVAVESGTSVEYTVAGAATVKEEPETKDEVYGRRPAGLMPARSLPCRDIFPLRRRHRSSLESQHHARLQDRDGDREKYYSKSLHGEYLCRLCGSRYENFSSLNAHNYDVHCRFTCRSCLNTFSMMCNLKRHERLHIGRKQYTCVQCAKGFSRNSDLRIHALKLHRRPSLGIRHQPLQHSTAHAKKGKAAVLGDILSKLALKQLQNLRDREKRQEDKSPRPSEPEIKQHNEADAKANIVLEPLCEADENTVGLKQKTEGTDEGSKEYTQPRKGTRVAMIPTPLLTPVFSRSILKQSVRVNSIPELPKKVVHIYPTCNSSSGGHMEEAPPQKKAKYAGPFSMDPNGTDQSSYDASMVHGLSFGRIVFPNQPAIKTEPPESHSCPEAEMTVGLPNLPFLTYSGRKPPAENIQRTDLVEGVDRSELCLSPTPAVLVRSGSSSPTHSWTPPSVVSSSATNRDEQQEWPALIALDRRYWCQLCKTQWENFGSYESHHVSQHLRYPCQFCDQTFSNKNNRSRHIRSHTGQKEHICPDCGKSFSRSDTLKEHQIIHTDGYLGDQCDYCHVVIKKKAELLGHIKKCSQRQRGRHSASVSPSSSPPPPTRPMSTDTATACILSV